jgi:aspartate/methionine/tyrosine aminotransferase
VDFLSYLKTSKGYLAAGWRFGATVSDSREIP